MLACARFDLLSPWAKELLLQPNQEPKDKGKANPFQYVNKLVVHFDATAWRRISSTCTA